MSTKVFDVDNFSFAYPASAQKVLEKISFSVSYGEFIAICGKSGSGKSTLLRNLKPALAPNGTKSGDILFYGRPVDGVSFFEQSKRIGYVLQNPDNQIVTDKVWHELAFGLESLGYDSKVIRLRVAEMASFFGIQTWFRKDVSSLSGGQKQILNLAGIMAMAPDVLILDEPTAQLDPIAAEEFLDILKKINEQIGTTVIISEHRLENVFPMSDRAVVLEGGAIIANAPPAEVGAGLAAAKDDMYISMPAPLQISMAVRETNSCPLTVREGREWLTDIFRGRDIKSAAISPAVFSAGDPAIKMKDVWFRYEKNGDDVIRDLSFEAAAGKLHCIVGGNGTGKSTALKLIGGIKKPYRGKITTRGSVGTLPQNPQSFFMEKTVKLELLEMKNDNAKVDEIAGLLEIDGFFDRHPYDLSGGEQQKVALAKILLLDPDVLLLDEPTKGLDAHFKEKLAVILKKLLSLGKTILIVSHDVEFCAKHADACSLFFDGSVITTNEPVSFFSGNSFYTTASNRMSRHIFDNAVTVEDVVLLCKSNLQD